MCASALTRSSNSTATPFPSSCERRPARPTFARRANRAMSRPSNGAQTSGPATVGPIAKGLCGPGLLAFVVTSKFADHLPLSRLEGIIARSGVRVSENTLGDWMRQAATLLKPLRDLMHRRVLKSRVIWTDDTRSRYAQPGRALPAIDGPTADGGRAVTSTHQGAHGDDDDVAQQMLAVTRVAWVGKGLEVDPDGFHTHPLARHVFHPGVRAAIPRRATREIRRDRHRPRCSTEQANAQIHPAYLPMCAGRGVRGCSKHSNGSKNKNSSALSSCPRHGTRTTR